MDKNKMVEKLNENLEINGRKITMPFLNRLNCEFITNDVEQAVNVFEEWAKENNVPYRIFDFDNNKDFTIIDKTNFVNEVDEIGGIMLLKNYVLGDKHKRYWFASAYKDNEKVVRGFVEGYLTKLLFTVFINTADKTLPSYKQLDPSEMSSIETVNLDK